MIFKDPKVFRGHGSWSVCKAAPRPPPQSGPHSGPEFKPQPKASETPTATLVTKAHTPSAPRLHFLRRHSHARRAAGLRNCAPLPSRASHPHPLLHIPDRLSEPVHRSLAVSGHRETYCWGFRRPRIVQICCVVVVVRLVGQVLRRDGVR